MPSLNALHNLFNLQCSDLAFFRPDKWIWLLEQFGYCGEYEFIFLE